MINPRYDAVGSFCGGVAKAQADQLWGYIDTSGHFIIPPRYESADDFSEGRASVKMNGKFGFIDRTGTWLIRPHFDDARGFAEGLAAVYIASKGWGFIGHDGGYRIAPAYSWVGDFVDGYALALSSDGFTVIDTKAEATFPLTGMTSINEGMRIEYRIDEKRSGGWWLVRQNGEPVHSSAFDQIGSLSGGVAFARRGDQVFILHKSGKVIQINAVTNNIELH